MRLVWWGVASKLSAIISSRSYIYICSLFIQVVSPIVCYIDSRKSQMRRMLYWFLNLILCSIQLGGIELKQWRGWSSLSIVGEVWKLTIRNSQNPVSADSLPQKGLILLAMVWKFYIRFNSMLLNLAHSFGDVIVIVAPLFGWASLWVKSFITSNGRKT